MFFSTMLHTDRASITVEFAAGSADPYQEDWKINKKTGPTCSEDLRSRTLATDAFFLSATNRDGVRKMFKSKMNVHLLSHAVAALSLSLLAA